MRGTESETVTRDWVRPILATQEKLETCTALFPRARLGLPSMAVVKTGLFQNAL